MEEIKKIILDILEEELEIDRESVKESDMLINDLFADSLIITRIIVAIEDAYDVVFEDDDVFVFEDISLKDFIEIFTSELFDMEENHG